MAYLVNLTARAERDLAQLFVDINAEHSEAALKRYRGIIRMRFSAWRNNRTDALSHLRTTFGTREK
jgi:hypothetical protein